MGNGRWGGRARDGGPGSGPKGGGGKKADLEPLNSKSMSAKRIVKQEAPAATPHVSTYGSYGQGGRPRNRTREMSPEASHSMHSASSEAKKGQSPFKR